MAENNLKKEIKKILTEALLPTWEKHKAGYSLKELEKISRLVGSPLKEKVAEEIIKRRKEVKE